MSTTKKYQRFEKLVAAVHRAEMKGAEVTWNETLAGRQFDVVVRFKAGLYEYLTVVECRDRKKPLSVDNVDGLVTKAKDVGANKAVLVSASGFQSGCMEVAKRHGVELFTLRELEEVPVEKLGNVFFPVLNFHAFVLQCPKERVALPEQRNILPFLIRDSKIRTDRTEISMDNLLDKLHDSLMRTAEPQAKTFKYKFPPFTVVEMADIKSGNTLERIKLWVTGMEFKYQVVEGRHWLGIGLDPYLLAKQYEFRNELSGEAKRMGLGDLEVGHDTVFQAGHFYYNCHNQFRYYCRTVEGDLITLTMLEAYQHGRHMQATFTVLRENANAYLEVEDGEEVKRLSAMLETLNRLSGKRQGAE